MNTHMLVHAACCIDYLRAASAVSGDRPATWASWSGRGGYGWWMYGITPALIQAPGIELARKGVVGLYWYFSGWHS